MSGTLVDMGGDDLVVDTIAVGATSPGSAGTTLTSTNLGFLNVTAGTAAASKAIVLDSSSNVSGINQVGTKNIKLSAGGVIDADVATATLSSNAATITKHAAVITSEALTTAAGATQAFVITLTGVAAGDLAFVQGTGTGTNTRLNHTYKAACTTNTITVTVCNNEPTNALNGTLIFNLLHIKSN